MAILPTRYPLKPPIVNILGLKSDFDFFGVADYASGRKISFLVVGGGFFLKIQKKVFNKKVLYWYPAHTLKWALQNNFTPPPTKAVEDMTGNVHLQKKPPLP